MSNNDILAAGSLTVHVPEIAGAESIGQLEECQNRTELFYDEQLAVYIRLKLDDDLSAPQDEDSEREASDFSQVAIAVEIKVEGTVFDRDQSKDRSFVTHTQYLRHKDLVSSTANEAIWAFDAQVEHPRTRLLNPRILIDAALNITAVQEEEERPNESSTRYLTPFEPVQEINLLQALGHGSKLNRLKSSLSASRVMISDSEAPKSLTPESEQNSTHLEYEKQIRKLSAALSIPVFRALSLRLRTTKAAGIHDNVIAILEIGSSELSKFTVDIRSAKVELLGGSATPLGAVEFPQSIGPSESWSASFNLHHSDLFVLTKELQPSRIKPVSIQVEYVPILTTCAPIINTKWDTIVNFDIDTNAPHAPPQPTIPPPAALSQTAPGTPSMHLNKVMNQHHHRVVSRTSSTTSLPLSNPRQQPSAQTAPKFNTPNLSGLTLSFSGPSTVKVGESFRWKVFAMNKSQSTRHLSLYVQAQDKTFEKSLPRNAELYPVIDRVALKKMYQFSALTPVGLISLNNDIRIGPLQPQSCYETELSILALSAGVHSLEGVTVVDQRNGEIYECGRLLEVVVNDF